MHLKNNKLNKGATLMITVLLLSAVCIMTTAYFGYFSTCYRLSFDYTSDFSYKNMLKEKAMNYFDTYLNGENTYAVYSSSDVEPLVEPLSTFLLDDSKWNGNQIETIYISLTTDLNTLASFSKIYDSNSKDFLGFKFVISTDISTYNKKTNYTLSLTSFIYIETVTFYVESVLKTYYNPSFEFGLFERS